MSSSWSTEIKEVGEEKIKKVKILERKEQEKITTMMKNKIKILCIRRGARKKKQNKYKK